MGNGALSRSVSGDASFDPYESVIINSLIKIFTPMMANNEDLRGFFANHVASSMWIEEFVKRANYVPDQHLSGRLNHTMDGLHMIDHLRYELPSGQLFPASSHEATAQIVDAVATAEEMNDKQQRRIEKRRAAVDTHTFLDSESLQYLICATLIPSFLQSKEFLDWYKKNNGVEKQSYRLDQNQFTRDLKSFVKNSEESFVANFQLIVNDDAQIELSNSIVDEMDEEEEAVALEFMECPIMQNYGLAEVEFQQGEEKLKNEGLLATTSYYEILLVQTVAKIDMMSLTNTLSTDMWLREVLRYLETLPVAISIADAHRRPNETFPLIYVNHAFEKLTGFHRQEVLGRNSRFMQSKDYTEIRQVERMIVSLREAKPIKLAVTNVRKDGSWFLNFLALRPVHNRDNEYSFVVGISYDILQSKATAVKLGNGQCTSHHTESNKVVYLGANHWWHSHQDEHDALIEDLEGIDALLRLIPMLLVGEQAK